MSSFESMSATLSKDYWGLHSKPMHERNYPCERWIYSYFRTIDLNQTGAAAFQRQLYFCMLGQALFLKAQVEGWRANNVQAWRCDVRIRLWLGSWFILALLTIRLWGI